MKVYLETIALALILGAWTLACDDNNEWGDADADTDGDVDGDGDIDGDVDGDVDGDGDADADGDSEPDGSPCTDPPGAACNPIPITSFPYSHDGDTTTAPEALIDAYSCRPDLNEQGPELHYELVLDSPRIVSANVVEADGVDVDIHLLWSNDPDDCIARANTDLEQALGAGTYRLVVDTYHDGGDLAGAYTLNVTAAEPPPATALGTMWNTYYFLANEAEHTGAQDVPIYDSSCGEIARVRAEFHDSVCIEGSGILDDGRVINYASTCTSSCPSARLCGSYSYRICYSVLDSDRYPWGMGAGSRALVPDFSIAVDTDFVALGTVIYFEELDGIVPPGDTAPHDGCMRADDVGGAIEGNHFDFFSGTRGRWLEWESIFPTRSNFTAWTNHPRCYGY